MKIGLTISTILHAVLLGWGLIVLAPPKSHDVADVEALPVDIIPVSSITRVQQGVKEEPEREIAAPLPTVRPEPVEDARTIGNNTVDLKSADTEKQADFTVEKAIETASAPASEPAPVPEPRAEVEPTEAPKPQASTEIASLPDKPQEVSPDPVDEPVDQPKPEEAALPERIPTPKARPEPPKRTEVAARQESDFNADQIEALLNRQDTAGGGAARSREQASLGSDTQQVAQTLSISEIDALRRKVESCWQLVAGMSGAEDVRIQVKMNLNQSGYIDGQPQVDARGGTDTARRTLSDSVRRAVLRCEPYELPIEKYGVWSNVVLNFDPSQMF